jgi:tetratricopeptide (TPR) repeat protein
LGQRHCEPAGSTGRFCKCLSMNGLCYRLNIPSSAAYNHIAMKQYPRLPPLLVLILCFGLGVLYLRTWGRPPTGDNLSLDELAQLISNDRNNKDNWQRYAVKLEKEHQYSESARAYARLLELDPGNQKVRYEYAMVLYRGKLNTELLKYLEGIIDADPKVVDNLFERELADLAHSNDKFEALRTKAARLIMD